MSNSYEELRDQATGDGADAWRAADREEGNLRALYRELKEDPRFTDEHKAEKAWERYEATKEKIAAGKAKAKALLEKRSRSAERSSLPFPDGEFPVTTDTSKLLASQNEASRLVRKLDRMSANARGPFAPDRTGALRQEYARGLEAGGVQGGAICRGVLAAADELGEDRHSIVEGFRKTRHRESLERARHSEMLSSLIGGAVPEPPFARPGRGRGLPGEPRKGANTLLLLGRQTAEEPARRGGRRPPWK